MMTGKNKFSVKCVYCSQDHHFRVIQFPLNFAETQVLTVSNTLRTPDGVAIDKDLGVKAPTLFEVARAHGLAVLTNRPLDGIYKESHGFTYSILGPEKCFIEFKLLFFVCLHYF